MVKVNKADLPTVACLTLISVTAQADQLGVDIMTIFIILGLRFYVRCALRKKK
jgi:hypothetical protein